MYNLDFDTMKQVAQDLDNWAKWGKGYLEYDVSTDRGSLKGVKIIRSTPIRFPVYVPDIELVTFNPKKKITYVKFKDGTDVQVKCKEGEEFSEYYGLCAAITKKFYGGNAEINRILKNAKVVGKKNKQTIKESYAEG